MIHILDPKSIHCHPDWIAIVRGIIDNPHEEVRRLVASDWLYEHGEIGWAEFIRLQIQEPTRIDKQAELLKTTKGMPLGIIRKGWDCVIYISPAFVFHYSGGFVSQLEGRLHELFTYFGRQVICNNPIEYITVTDAARRRRTDVLPDELVKYVRPHKTIDGAQKNLSDGLIRWAREGEA